MIVLNDEDDQAIQKLREDRASVAGPSTSQPAPTPTPSASTRLLRPSAEPHFEAPPAYPGTGYQTFPQPPPRLSPTSQDSLPPPASAENKRPERSTWRRFVKALVIALILYALALVLYALVFGRRESIRWDGPKWPELPDVQHCSTYYQLGDENYSLTKDLPVGKEGLFFVTLGDQAAGSVHFVYDGSLRENAQAYIETSNLDAEQQKLLAQTQICVLQVGQTQGIGISTPSKRTISRALHFNVTLSLPYVSSSYSRPRGLKSLRSSAKNFMHTLDIPQDRYFVESVDFTATNQPIMSGSISADSVAMQTTNALIGGEFTVNKLLDLETKNGRIESSVIARNDPRRKEETKIILTSTNSPISGLLDLQSAASNGKGGHFRVTAKTTNSPIELMNEQLSLEATLALGARTTNSPVTAHLAPAFEGSFSLATTNQGTSIIQINHADPAHRSRKRNVTIDSTGTRSTGFATWSKDGTEKGCGEVSLASVNSPVILYV